jgi:hypothetical protein
MTPEEIQQAARMRAAALRGEEPQAMPVDTREADALSGIGGALAGLGGRSVRAMSQDMTDRGDVLRQLAARWSAAKTPEELEAMTARAEYERAKAANLGKAPGMDPLRREDIELRIQERRQKLAAGGEGAKRQGDEVYKWSGRLPAGIKDGLDSIARMESIAAEFGGIDRVPGVGLGESLKPGQMLHPRADEFRRTGLAVISKYRNKMFGASLTPGEQAAFAEIANLGPRATAAQVANAMALLKKGFQSDAEQALAGSPEHVKDAIGKDIRFRDPPKVGKSGLTPEQRRAEIERLRNKVAAEGAK